MSDRAFDALMGELARIQSRRGALAALLGAALLRRAPAPGAAAGDKRRSKGKGKRHCYRKGCRPGPGRNNARCNFKNSLRFHELDARGVDLSRANLTNAQLDGADLTGANLSGACLVGANLLGATIDETTRLDGAVFCRTLMPDGSERDDDCGGGTRCCPAPSSCEGEGCPAACISAPNAQCSWNVPYGGCCPGLHCVPSSTAPLVTTCQAPCGADGSCRARFGAAWVCAPEPVRCRYLRGECCQHR